MFLKDAKAVDDLGNEYPVDIQKTNGVERIQIQPEQICGAEYIDILLPAFNTEVGTHGYYLAAGVRNGGSWLCRFDQTENQEHTYQSAMRVFGVKNTRCAIAIVTGMWYDVSMVMGVKDGCYYIYPRIHLYGRKPDEAIGLEIHRLADGAGYPEMAKAYRDYQLRNKRCVPLAERVKTRQELEYARDSIEIRIRMGWKPAPPEVLEQTAENEPDMKVACTFAQVMKIIDELKAQGVDKAQLCLVGWNKSGHDGRWPQVFPVEERLGGEEALCELIAYAQANGYQITCHTNSTDAYTIADNWDEDLIRRDRNGEKVTDPVPWSGGTMYHLCPQKAWELAQKTLPRVAELGFRGLHYVDVLSIIPLRDCFDSRHPVTPGQALRYHEKIMEFSHELFGGFSSEGCYDFASRYLDWGLYDEFESSMPDAAFFSESIPFFALVYHGIILYNPSTATVNFPIKDKKQMLKLIEYGGRPVIYIHSDFYNNNVWMGKEDLTIRSPEEIKYSVSKIKEAYDLYKQVRHLQTEFMESHEHIAPGRYAITYTDGTAITVDYEQETFEVCPAMGASLESLLA